MIKRHWASIAAFIFISLFSLWLNFPSDGPPKYAQVKRLIAQNKFQAALASLDQQLTSKDDNYFLDLYLGEIYAGLAKPAKSLHYYELAYRHIQYSDEPILKRVVLFKLAHTQLWLGQYQQALESYHQLLQMKLSNTDKGFAQTGFNKSLALQYQRSMDQLAAAHHQMRFLCSIPHFALGAFCEKPFTIPAQHSPIPNLAEVLRARRYQALKIARHYIAINDGKRAYKLIKIYLETDRTFMLEVMAAQSMAMMGAPKKSLQFYTQAFTLSTTETEQKTALLGMLKMQLWLNEAKEAEISLQRLRTLSLNTMELRELRQTQTRLSQLTQQLKYTTVVQQAQHFIDINQGKKAFAMIQPYLYQQGHRYTSMLIAAQSMSVADQPQQALYFYQQAYRLSHRDVERIPSLLGIAKMQFWLAHYVRAAATYRSILNYKLTSQGYQQALAGLVKSLAYYNRPRRGVHAIPCGLDLKTPALVIAAAQATLWADWADLTKHILTKYKPIIDNIPLNTGLGSDLQDLKWQTKLATSLHVVTPSLFVSSDSETFNKKRMTVDYTHYWNQSMQTSLGPDYIVYKQNPGLQTAATGFYFEQTLRPTRNLILRGQIEPIAYKNSTPSKEGSWDLMLWKASSLYRPNDMVSLQLLALKEVVETFPAFSNRITGNQYAGVLNLNPLPYVQLNGSLSKLDFSDQNVRPGYFLAASWLMLPNVGLSTTGILRGYSNRVRSPNYFSPNQYKAESLLFKLGRKFGPTWHYYLDGGFGRQYITPLPNTPTNSSPTYQWGLGMNGPLTSSIVLNVYFADSRQASAFIDSPDYHYQYGGISLSFMGL